MALKIVFICMFLLNYHVAADDNSYLDVIVEQFEKNKSTKSIATNLAKKNEEVYILVINANYCDTDLDTSLIELCNNFYKTINDNNCFYYQHEFMSKSIKTNFLASFIQNYSEHKEIYYDTQKSSCEQKNMCSCNFHKMPQKEPFKISENIANINDVDEPLYSQIFKLFDNFCNDKAMCDYVFRIINANTKNLILTNVAFIVIDKKSVNVGLEQFLNFLSDLRCLLYGLGQETVTSSFLIIHDDKICKSFDIKIKKNKLQNMYSYIRSQHFPYLNNLFQELDFTEQIKYNMKNSVTYLNYNNETDRIYMSKFEIKTYKFDCLLLKKIIEEHYLLGHVITFMYYQDIHYIYFYDKIIKSQCKGNDIKKYIICYITDSEDKLTHLLDYNYYNDKSNTNSQIIETEQKNINVFFRNLFIYSHAKYFCLCINEYSMLNNMVNIYDSTILTNSNGLLSFVSSEKFYFDLHPLKNLDMYSFYIREITFCVASKASLDYYLMCNCNIGLDTKSNFKIVYLESSCMQYFFASVNNLQYLNEFEHEKTSNTVNLRLFILVINDGRREQKYYIFHTTILHLYKEVSKYIEISKTDINLDQKYVAEKKHFSFLYIKTLKIYQDYFLNPLCIPKRICELIFINYFKKNEAIDHTFYMINDNYAISYIQYHIFLMYITICYLDFLKITDQDDKVDEIVRKIDIKYEFNIDDIKRSNAEEIKTKYLIHIKNKIGDNLEYYLHYYFTLDDTRKKKSIYDFFNTYIQEKGCIPKYVVCALFKLQKIFNSFYAEMYKKYQDSIKSPNFIAGIIPAAEYCDQKLASIILKTAIVSLNL